MMDLSLDHKQAEALQCSTCDPSKMRLRNCNGAYGEKSQSPMVVNGTVYRSCPRAIAAQDWQVGYLVSLYFECKENKVVPGGSSLMDSTAFCKEVFDQMGSIVSEYRIREQKKADDKAKSAEIANRTKSRK